MDKPKPKMEARIVFARDRGIMMNASKDAIEDFREFGPIVFLETQNLYWLTVDARYSFNEVIEYIEEYG